MLTALTQRGECQDSNEVHSCAGGGEPGGAPPGQIASPGGGVIPAGTMLAGMHGNPAGIPGTPPGAGGAAVGAGGEPFGGGTGWAAVAGGGPCCGIGPVGGGPCWGAAPGGGAPCCGWAAGWELSWM